MPHTLPSTITIELISNLSMTGEVCLVGFFCSGFCLEENLGGVVCFA